MVLGINCLCKRLSTFFSATHLSGRNDTVRPVFILYLFSQIRVSAYLLPRYVQVMTRFRQLHTLHLNYAYISDDIVKILTSRSKASLRVINIKVMLTFVSLEICSSFCSEHFCINVTIWTKYFSILKTFNVTSRKSRCERLDFVRSSINHGWIQMIDQSSMIYPTSLISLIFSFSTASVALLAQINDCLTDRYLTDIKSID